MAEGRALTVTRPGSSPSPLDREMPESNSVQRGQPVCVEHAPTEVVGAYAPRGRRALTPESALMRCQQSARSPLSGNRFVADKNGFEIRPPGGCRTANRYLGPDETG